MMQSEIIYERVLEPGAMWSQTLKRGKVLRIKALEEGANAGMLLYNANLPLERYNMPDTLKGQQTFYLTSPHCLHSDMGRILASLTSDTVGWHDTVCGCSDSELVRQKYGDRSFQRSRNEFHRNARECFLIEMAKWGLGERDLIPNLNFFSKVVPDSQGALQFVEGHSQPGDCLELRFEMDTLVILNTCQHPLDPDPLYKPRRVSLAVSNASPPSGDDPCLTTQPENKRAYQNTQHYHLLRS